MKFRPKRETHEAEMQECVEFHSRDQFVKIVGEEIKRRGYTRKVFDAEIGVVPYRMIEDTRNKWARTYLVEHSSLGPIGWTDAACE